MNVWAIAGLIVMVLSQAATLAGLEPFASWNTPIAWTGFIVFADSLVWQARGRSWLRSSPGEFAFLAIVSIPLWLVFEFFNLYLDNWYYVGLPEHAALRLFGYAWSFATIWPAVFEAAFENEEVEALGERLSGLASARIHLHQRGLAPLARVDDALDDLDRDTAMLGGLPPHLAGIDDDDRIRIGVDRLLRFHGASFFGRINDILSTLR